jgi:DNA invertase Pin-like site-specific DNA recombinase
VIYLQRSKETKGGRSVSIEAQRAAAERYAKELGFTVVATLVHDGVSGGRRGRFVELDASVKDHGASKVICANLDRAAMRRACSTGSTRRPRAAWSCGRSGAACVRPGPPRAFSE